MTSIYEELPINISKQQIILSNSVNFFSFSFPIEKNMKIPLAQIDAGKVKEK